MGGEIGSALSRRALIRWSSPQMMARTGFHRHALGTPREPSSPEEQVAPGLCLKAGSGGAAVACTSIERLSVSRSGRIIGVLERNLETFCLNSDEEAASSQWEKCRNPATCVNVM